MRILVTGSNGQLGTELQRVLADTSHEVLGVDLDTCDLSDRDQSIGLVTSFSPELILHGAAFTAVDRCEVEPELAFRSNSLATRFLADGARRVGAHVVYVSTDYVFDGATDRPYREWDRPNPQSIYGLSKLGGEAEIDRAWTIARTSWVCSAHGNNMVKTVLRLANEVDELTFVDDQIGHPTFASDLAAMIAKLGIERVPGIHHVTNAGQVSWFEFVREILKAGGHDPAMVKPVSTAEFLANRAADAPPMAQRPMFSVLDNFALRSSGLGEMRHFTEPLAEVVAALSA